MSPYQHILVAIDLSENSAQVLQKAQLIAQQNNAALSILYVIEPIADAANYAFDSTISIDYLPIQQDIEASSNEKISALTSSLALLEKKQYVEIGRPADTIHQFCDEHNCDLIIIGSHGRHGISLLLGSTANAVLHGAKCDVLAVRFKESLNI